MELKLTKMALIDPVESILIEKGEIALSLIIFLVVVGRVLNKTKSFQGVEYDICKFEVEFFVV